MTVLGVLGFGLWAIGQIVRDRTWWSGLCFYVPSPVVAVCLLGAAVVSLRSRRRRMGLALLLASLPPLLVVAAIENRWQRPEPPADSSSLRLVHWNVLSGHLGWDGIRSILREYDADLYVLSEFPRDEELGPTARFLGGYRALRLGTMVVFARGLLEKRGCLSRDGKLECHAFRWTIEGNRIEVLLGDIASDLRVPRDPYLRRLMRLTTEHSPDLVLGDFNAPRRSRRLDPLPAGYRHAYDVAGSGWSYTWPVPIPVYAIDQCIVAERVVCRSYSLRSTLRSDHRLQVLDFSFEKPAPSSAPFPAR